MKRSVFNLMIIPAVFLMAACSILKPTQQTTTVVCNDGSANYPWLGVGHEWHYAYQNGNVKDSMITKITASPSPGTYRSETRFVNSGRSSVLFYHACGQDLYTSTKGDYLQYKYWWFSLSVKAGDLWSREVPGFLYTYQLVGKNVTVQTTLRHQTFINCYQFTAHDPFNGITDTIYFRPDLGIVFFNGQQYQYELVSKNYGSAQ